MTPRFLLYPLLAGIALAGGVIPSTAQPGTPFSSDMDIDSAAKAGTAASIRSVVEAERTFRADVARLGVRDGFIKHFAADGVLFRPGPVNALEYLRAQESQPGLLEWEPEFASVAVSNDLGFTTGPWTYRPGEADSVVASGFYATVWRRDANGVWRVAIDHGVSLGRTAPVPVPMEVASPGLVSFMIDAGAAAPELGSSETTTRGGLPDEIMQLDRVLSIEAGRVEDVKRFLGRVSDDARFLRQGKLPISGIRTIEALLMLDPGGVAYAPAGVGMSQLMDFAYTWGGYWPGLLDGGTQAGVARGNYVHIWRNEESGWKLLFEVLSPHPPAPPKEP